MSASAKVYISVDYTEKPKDTDAVHSAIEDAIRDIGFPTAGDRYTASKYFGGDIYESESHSIHWDVFGEGWVKELVKKVYEIDDRVSVLVSVYNLDREPDTYYTTDMYETESSAA